MCDEIDLKGKTMAQFKVNAYLDQPIVLCLITNKMHMNHKRQHSLRVSRQKQKIQQLISEFNQQLHINSTQQNFTSPLQRLPQLPHDRTRARSDRFASERLKYQHNLHTIIDEIKNKMDSTHRSAFRSTKIRRKGDMESPVKLLNKAEFKIKALTLSPQKPKQELTKSYVQATQKRLAEQRIKKRMRYERFDFQPWGTLQEVEVVQTINF